MSRLSRFTTRKSKRKERTVESSLCCGSYSAPFIHSLLSSLVVDRERKEEARGKSRIFRGILLMTNAISRNIVDTILLRKYFKDLMNTRWSQRMDAVSYKIQKTRKINMLRVCISASTIMKYFCPLHFAMFYSFNGSRE